MTKKGTLIFIVGVVLFIFAYCYVDMYRWMHGYTYPTEPVIGGWWDSPEVTQPRMLLYCMGILLMLAGAYMIIKERE
jgi:hypothetical protein